MRGAVPSLSNMSVLSCALLISLSNFTPSYTRDPIVYTNKYDALQSGRSAPTFRMQEDTPKR